MRSRDLILISTLFLSFVIALPSAHALPVGAPGRTVEVGGFSLSGTIGYTDLEVRNSDVTTKSFFFKGAFGGTDGVTPYLRLGFADLEVEGGFKGNLGFAFGGGVLLDLITQQSGSGFRVSLDSQAQWSESSEGSASYDMFEGQVSLLGSARSSGTNAYAGIATSFINLDGEKDDGQAHLFFGMDYFMDYNFFFSAEAHLFGQDTLSIGVGYNF
ncbi:MAG: hypothetical protein P1S46_02705 [bacterium]|nr:hypothetical protein [bacterium]MDT8396462.1 hypothetical protein [bacterium]